ncbi:pickpocket protein 28-like [Lycorma delicatula]|uniref:pickpocket protein 28-like n=1 Tax=Lycorma delicatula TaxID=130591 RepID=UPI003F50E800
MKSEAHVFVHDPKEINMNEDQGLFVMRSYSVIIFIKNLATVIADESAKELKFNKRNCVLPGELDDKMSYYLMYSRSACEIECEFYKQMNKCNCSKHTLLKTNDNGINCTNDIQSAYCYSSMDQKRTENCFCPPTCEINEFRVVWHQFKRLNKKKSIQIKVETLSPQTERIIMRPRFTRFEIFVGLACFTRIITSKSFLWFGYYLLRIIFIKRNDEKSKNNIAYQYSSCLI